MNRDGVATARLGRLRAGNKVRVVVSYSGNDGVRAARVVHTVKVRTAPRSKGGRR